MKNAFILLRVQALSLINSLAPGMQRQTNQAKRVRRLVFTAIGFILLVALCATYLFLSGAGLTAMGLANVIPALATLMGSIVGVVFAFTKTRGILFDLRDFDHVMSLPIARRTIVATRLATLYGSAILLALVVMTPLFAAYFLVVTPTFWSVGCAMLSVLFAPLVPVSIAIFLAFIITAIAAHFRHANAVFILFALALILAVIVGVYGLSFSMNTMSDAAILATMGDLATAVDTQVRTMWPPAAWAAYAITDGSALSLALFGGVSIAVPALTLEIIQRNYLTLTGILASRSSAHKRIRQDSQDQMNQALSIPASSKPFFALIKKEFHTIVGIPTYAINCLFGYLFMMLIAGALAIFGLDPLLSAAASQEAELTAAEYQQALSLVMSLIPWVFAFCALMSPTAACSVSLEGHAVWIMQTAPLSTQTILGAKLASNAIPQALLLIFCGLMCCITGALTPLIAFEIPLLGFGMFYLVINVGLALDVARPNLSWSSPNEVVKRGLPITVCILSGLFLIFAGIAGTIALSVFVGSLANHIYLFTIAILCCGAGHLIFIRTSRKAVASLQRG